jgi:hypothetical protein
VRLRKMRWYERSDEQEQGEVPVVQAQREVPLVVVVQDVVVESTGQLEVMVVVMDENKWLNRTEQVK